MRVVRLPIKQREVGNKKAHLQAGFFECHKRELNLLDNL